LLTGFGSPSKRRYGRKRRFHSDEEEDTEFDCLSFAESSVSINRPKRASHLRKETEEICDEIEDMNMPDEFMDKCDKAREEFYSAESEFSYGDQKAAVNNSLGCVSGLTSISDMKRIAARLTVMMAVYGRPSSFAPLLQELSDLTSVFDHSKLVLCDVNTGVRQ